MLAGFSLHCQIKLSFCVFGQVLTLWLQWEVNAQNVELSVNFDIATIHDEKLIELLVLVLLELASVLRNHLHQLIEQRINIETLQYTTIERVLTQTLLYFVE